MAPDFEKIKGGPKSEFFREMGMSGNRGKSIDEVHLSVDSDREPQSMRKGPRGEIS